MHVELIEGFLLVCRSSESGKHTQRSAGICGGAHEMGGIFEVHCAVLIQGFEWHGPPAETSS